MSKDGLEGLSDFDKRAMRNIRLEAMVARSKQRNLETIPPDKQTLRMVSENLGTAPTAEQLEGLKELLLQERFAIDKLLNLVNTLLGVE